MVDEFKQLMSSDLRCEYAERALPVMVGHLVKMTCSRANLHKQVLILSLTHLHRLSKITPISQHLRADMLLKKMHIGKTILPLYQPYFFDQFSANRDFGFAETLSFFLEFLVF